MAKGTATLNTEDLYSQFLLRSKPKVSTNAVMGIIDSLGILNKLRST